jgi:hypothetical protein
MKINFFGALVAFALTLSGCGSSDGPTTLSQDRIVTVEAEQTLATRIDAGKYDSVNDAILPNFKSDAIVAPYEAKLVVISFNRSISSENAEAEMKARGLRPANLNECLAYGAAIAKARAGFDLQAPNYWTVCLGSSTNIYGRRVVPVLIKWNGDWRLDLDPWAPDWDRDLRFLSVR